MTEPDPLTPSTAATQHTGATDKPFILVIDDSRLVRVSIKKTLADEFTIIEAADGEEGWEMLNGETRIQVVITDAGMPRLDGYGLISRIRDDSNIRIKEIPVMMITGAEAGETEARERALNLGATDFITKPFDKTQLLARVRGYTKLDQTQRNLENTEVALAEQSVIDTITGIHNRRYFLQRGEQHLAFVRRHSQDLSIIVVGIDNFSDLQDRYGVKIANQTLGWAARLVTDIKRKEDIIARVDQSRFAIAAPTAGRMAAAVLCERIREHFIESKFTDTTHSLSVTASLGLACLGREASESVEDLLKLAEDRVRQAQKLGGNRTVASNNKANPQASSVPAPSVDAALAIIKSGHPEKTHPLLLILGRQVFPILEMCNKKLNWNIDEHITAIKLKLEG